MSANNIVFLLKQPITRTVEILDTCSSENFFTDTAAFSLEILT